MRPRPGRSRSRGTTLIEILISLAVVLVGMLALFKTLATSVTGSMTASRLSQAQQRAVLVTEAIRVAPKAALTCLVQQSSNSWATCEATCKANLSSPYANKAESCIYSSLDAVWSLTCPNCTKTDDKTLQKDKSLQRYDLVTQNAKGPISQVKVHGLANSIYETQIVIGWRDDNQDASTAPDHFVTLRSGVFEPK